jgi:hypothetical protein
MSSKISGVFVAFLALVVLDATTWPRAALAADADARAAAKAKVERAAALLSEHDDAHALAEFEDAYRIFPSPKIFFDIGLANVGLGRNPEALRAFQRFLIEATDASTESLARAKTKIQALLPKVAIVDIVCPQAGLEIVVDDGSVGRSPLAAPLYLTPGRHRLVARVNETAPPSVMTFDVTGGARISVSVPVAPPPVTSAPPVIVAPPPPLVDHHQPSESRERPVYARPWFWAAAAGLVAAAGVTLLLTVGKSTKDPTSSLGQMTLPGAP